MNNKKGFTLVELLAVLVILGIVSFIAVPNVIELINGNKKDAILGDARKMISYAKSEVLVNKIYRDSGSHKFKLNELNKNDLKSDPDGNDYDNDNSYVMYTKVDNVDTYCVYLKSTSMVVGQTSIGGKCTSTSVSDCTCVKEIDLFSRDKVYMG